jgi:hypothetical protein
MPCLTTGSPNAGHCPSQLAVYDLVKYSLLRQGREDKDGVDRRIALEASATTLLAGLKQRTYRTAMTVRYVPLSSKRQKGMSTIRKGGHP